MMAKAMLVVQDLALKTELETLLTSMGHLVVGQVASGEQTVRTAQTIKPDLILLDISIPDGIDGISLAESIRPESNAAVIFVTEHGDWKYPAGTKRAVPHGYVVRPFSENQMAAAIEFALHKKRQERQLEIANHQLKQSNTALKLELEERKRREKSYSLLVENARETILVAQHGRIVFINPRGEVLLGYSREELTSRPFTDFIHEEDREMVRNRYEKRLRGEDIPFLYDYRIVRKSGEVRWVALKAALLSWENQPATLCFLTDVTERKTAADALRQSEARFRQTFENIASGIALYRVVGNGDDFIFKDINPAGIRMAHKTREAHVGKSVLEVYPAVKEFGLFDVFQRVWRTGHPEHHPATLYKDEKVSLWTDNFVSKLPSGDIMSVYEDITARKRAEEEKERLESQLLQSQKMEAIGRLAGGIAHEFNNILGIIMGNTALALDDVPDWNPAKESLKEIQSAAMRAKNVVRQMLNFARKTMTVLKSVDVCTIARTSLELMRASIPTMIEIQSNIPSEPRMILGDPTEIHQIIMNLCTNAAHAMEEKGGVLEVGIYLKTLDPEEAVKYEAPDPGQYVTLSVKDTGEGMPPDVSKKIFEPYFTTKDQGKGTGMGLAAVYGIVKKCKGAIDVNSTVGKGTIVKILFPKFEEAEKPKTIKSAASPKRQYRILFVDDEPSLVRMAQQILERRGYTVVGATDSLTALERFRSDPDEFDLLITDMAMPHLAGDQLAIEVMKIRKNMPVLLCTGHSEKIDEERAKQIGIQRFIMKPLDMEGLSEAVQGFFSNP
jgi:PAS domain S-box-containing protein